jgi:hypothetical protein
VCACDIQCVLVCAAPVLEYTQFSELLINSHITLLHGTSPRAGHPLRGISVHCLMTTFLRECETAGFDLLAVPFPNVHDVVSKVILAKGEDVVCPRDGMLGAAYVDCVRGADNAGTATHMLSYTWGYPVIVIAQALQCYCESHGLDPKRTYVWICFACVNEHRILGKDEADPVNSAELEGIFAEKVMCVDAVLSLMYPWYHPMVLDRAWCVYEMFVATSTDGEEGVLPRQRRRRLTGDPIEMTAAAAAAKAKMKTIMHPICKGQFSDALADDPKVFRDLWRRTQEVSAERAQASIQADLEMIKDKIERGPTFPVLNRKVRGELARACIETAVANCECLLKGVHVDNKMRRWWARLGFWTREEFLGALAIPELCIPIDDTEAKAFFDELDAKGPGAVAALQTELKAIDAAGNPSYKSCPPSELLRAGVTTCVDVTPSLDASLPDLRHCL